MSESLCKTCKHKDDCDTTVRLYGIPNMRVDECKEYEPVDMIDGKNRILDESKSIKEFDDKMHDMLMKYFFGMEET